jgi:hypothetical protein
MYDEVMSTQERYAQAEFDLFSSPIVEASDVANYMAAEAALKHELVTKVGNPKEALGYDESNLANIHTAAKTLANMREASLDELAITANEVDRVVKEFKSRDEDDKKNTAGIELFAGHLHAQIDLLSDQKMSRDLWGEQE